MGEYAIRISDGEHVKIGTCESMYYMRADQIHDVRPLPGNVDPVADRDELLFRFPFPLEDGIEVGAFDGPAKGISLRGDIIRGEGFTHGKVQFRADNGYLVSLPCPESGERSSDGMAIELDGLRIGLNGYGGSCRLVGQRYHDGALVALVECCGCGNLYRLPTVELVMPVVESLRAERDRLLRDYKRTGRVADGDLASAERIHETIRRLLAGYEHAARV